MLHLQKEFKNLFSYLLTFEIICMLFIIYKGLITIKYVSLAMRTNHHLDCFENAINIQHQHPHAIKCKDFYLMVLSIEVAK